MKEQKQTISINISDSIKRCIERMQLEGNSTLLLPEQFAALMCVKLWQRRNGREKKLQMTEESIRKIARDYELCHVLSPWSMILEEVRLVTEPTCLQEIWRLVDIVCEEYEECTFKDVSSLGNVVEYMIETIARLGGREYFFTPSVIADLMIQLLAPGKGKLWDPACGSGTFLCKAMENLQENREENITSCLYIRGTDYNKRMTSVAGINLFFHGMTWERKLQGEHNFQEFGADLLLLDRISPGGPRNGVLLENADSLDVKEKFDYIVANPPVVSAYSSTMNGRGHIALTNALHLQFIQHIMQQLKESGQAAVLVNEGFLFSMKKAERAIRQALVEQHGLRTVISLPQGTFAPYTNAKSSILLFGGVGQRTDNVLFYDVEYVGYSLDKKRDIQEKNDIPDILQKEAERDALHKEWLYQKSLETVPNADGVFVPAVWQEEKVWFAEREQLKENDYIFLPTRYQPRPKNVEYVGEDPAALLKEILELEQKIQEHLERVARSVDER